MRRRLFLSFVAVSLLLIGVVPASAGVGLRLGGLGLLEGEEDTRGIDKESDFAIGVDGDILFTSTVALNLGLLLAIDPSSMNTDAYVGVRFIVPVAADKVDMTFRLGPLVRYLFDYDAPGDGGVGIGGLGGVGFQFHSGATSLFTVEFDVQVYKFLYPDSLSDADIQIGFAYLLGWKF